jgi:hypothetical protein
MLGKGNNEDFMGCFMYGWSDQNAEAAKKLTLRANLDTSTGRVLIYICPECGDIGCGAYSVLIEKSAGCYTWSSFAYEDSCDEARIKDGIGPFIFEEAAYEVAIQEAAAL